ncbi:Six-hairpin glycosidase-like protein [Pyrenochaeta sp. MPI-SDFR-AT-0127]|nr:Six-hairpin glycosidase-like protein [Pyrenochaeta sp. MPI-SDFR-AT-0127]
MSALSFDTKWIWHPDWSESPTSSSAGGFVDFRKEFFITQVPRVPLRIRLSADTRFKLYLNSRFIHAGPVKGDQQLWFFDELDIQPYLQQGKNIISIRVLRFYYATRFAPSFPRTHAAGLFLQCMPSDDHEAQEVALQTDDSWETSIDSSTRLPNDSKHDDFLHVFEDSDQQSRKEPTWVRAVACRFLTSFGLATPWRLSPRLIPYPKLERTYLNVIHKTSSTVPPDVWHTGILGRTGQGLNEGILLPAGTTHHIEIESDYTTGYIDFRFLRPKTGGSNLRVTYSECFEDEPVNLPYLRVKGNRCDSSKSLIGPSDRYTFGGPLTPSSAMRYREAEEHEETFAPFHFRTFRFLALDIEVAETSDLIFLGVEITKTNYPLQVSADITVPQNEAWVQDLWTVSLRTLENCMHDCYEDCPFYEQLQYAMDTRSSALFTYCVSGDDRLARQAIIQLHNSFQPVIGLTASRAPSHHLQIIPNFSLFWVCMLTDHYEYFGDADFVKNFLSVGHAVLDTFRRRIDISTGLVRGVEAQDQWDFVDWTDAWKPFGIPPAARRSGFQTFTNCLYAYTLKRVAVLLAALGNETLVAEYVSRADSVVEAILEHCFDGEFFTDGLARQAEPTDYSQHCQVWAVLCGAVAPESGSALLTKSLTFAIPIAEASPLPEHVNANSLSSVKNRAFTPVSTAMSFYSLRALSSVGGKDYDTHFSRFWGPWRSQLAQNLTTWVEDDVSQRSDCHAWGSLPLYEFVTEVAGIKPATPGWQAISFRPRVSLFQQFDAKVPIGGLLGPRTARVQWARDNLNATVKISLSLVNLPSELLALDNN